jgi:predicted cupin superfamily sugar epimerase
VTDRSERGRTYDPPVDATPAARAVIDRLGLVENPQAGWFRQVHECPHPTASGRSVATVITYLLDAVRPRAGLHRMSADAVHYFHCGAPLAVVTISARGEVERQVLGPDRLQVVVPGGTWKGFELLGGPYAVISEAVAPGWIPTDQEDAPADVARLWPTPATTGADDGATVETSGAIDWCRRLGLAPNPEGGFFRQTFESAASVATDAGERPLLNSIYYLLTASSPVGHLHRNRSDITHFHHHGGPATYVLVSPGGDRREVVLGSDLAAGQVLSFTAPGGWWKASSIAADVADCLISEAVAPGFRYDDHEMATIDGLAAEHPALLESLRHLVLTSA